MNSDLLFDFTVDKATHSIFVKRQFDAELLLVWDAFTKAEMLDQWGSPAPEWSITTIYMDFKVKGSRLYKMTGPEGQEHYSIQEYTHISPKTNFRFLSNFSDSEGKSNPQFKGSENSIAFSEENNITTVAIIIKYESAEVLEMMVAKGFKQGFTATLNNLDNLLKTATGK